MKRLLLIATVPPPHHGVATANAILLQSPRLQERFDIRHLDLSDHRPISTVEKFDWGNVTAAISHGLQCWWLMLTWRPAVVYLAISQKSLGFLRDALFLVPARLLGYRVVAHLHGGYLQEFYREAGIPMRWLIRFGLHRVHRAIVLGTSLRDCFAGFIPPERIVVVPNGIPDCAASRPPTAAHRLRVLYLGTVTRGKGIEVFLRAAQRLGATHADLEFIVAGPWYSATEQRELAPLTTGVKFLGEVSGPAKTAAWREADVFVFPSIQQEGLPLVILEAMCASLPVIAADCGCVGEVVREGATGYLVPPGDVPALVERLERLAADPALVRQLGAAGRHRYETEYTADRFVARMMQTLEEAATP